MYANITTKTWPVVLCSLRTKMGLVSNKPVVIVRKPCSTKAKSLQQFPLIALQSILLMSMGQFGHPGWLGARQTVIKIGDISVSKPIHFMLWADPAHDDWQSPS